MERKHSRKLKERRGGNTCFWEICLKFDIACICLLACLVISGMGRGEAVRQNIIAAVKMQAGTQDGDSQAAGAPQAEKKKVAITFDDGPHPQYTPEMLAGLKERNVKATFFLLGEEVEKYPELVKQIHEEGHLIGNHSYKHEQLSKLAMEQACAQVARTNEAIYKLTGTYPSYLRPPFGDWRQELDCKVNMVEVLWDVDTRDWSIQDHAKIVEKALKDVQENDIILMHDGYETSVTAAMEIIDTLQKQGYEFVTVDEMIFD
ncbi:MAG: polysaccharide deacetylase family protein [Lachnospiraceae bacterium]|jgi:peptidoglycan/xylan/chitin deacetylase (PgdA/CDA1 family)|nr:polysaccharide deacetylase family protein [Lachnospiraceae bacterium]